MLPNLRQYRIERRANALQNSSWLLADNVALLFGGNLDGSTVGLAYVGGMCSSSSVSLTQVG